MFGSLIISLIVFFALLAINEDGIVSRIYYSLINSRRMYFLSFFWVYLVSYTFPRDCLTTKNISRELNSKLYVELNYIIQNNIEIDLEWHGIERYLSSSNKNISLVYNIERDNNGNLSICKNRLYYMIDINNLLLLRKLAKSNKK